MNFIAGVWCVSNERAENINPSNTNDVIGQYARATAEQTNAVIAAATSRIACIAL
jgi:acyl-CoA reductase-like NAD-dependent aldehyde dehydrogenase